MQKKSPKSEKNREKSKNPRPPKWVHHWTRTKKLCRVNTEIRWFKTSRTRFRHRFSPNLRRTCSKTHFEKNGRKFLRIILQVAGIFSIFPTIADVSPRLISDVVARNGKQGGAGGVRPPHAPQGRFFFLVTHSKGFYNGQKKK